MVDMDRIRCVGYSRGAGFCSRLSSELSSFIAGIAAVSGILYPTPNNSTRPIPVIAFHGTEDPVMPYQGNGDFQNFWVESVPQTIDRWAEFNGCKQQQWVDLGPTVRAKRHSQCKQRGDVELVQIKGG